MSSHWKSNIAAPFLPFCKNQWIYGCSCVCSKAGTTTRTLSAVGQLRGRKAWHNLWYVIYYHFAAPWKMNFRKFWADGNGEHWENQGISKSIVLCWQKDTVTTHFSCQLAAVTQSIMVGCWITSQWNSAWRVILVLHGLWDKRGMNRPPGRGSTPRALIKVPIKKSNGTGNWKLASSACYRSESEQLSQAKGNISLPRPDLQNSSSLSLWEQELRLALETCCLLLPRKGTMLLLWNKQVLCCACVGHQSDMVCVANYLYFTICVWKMQRNLLSPHSSPVTNMSLEGLLMCARCKSGFLSCVGVISNFHRNPQQIGSAVITLGWIYSWGSGTHAVLSCLSLMVNIQIAL